MNNLAEYNGILCIDKPQGFTSFDVVAKMRGIAQTRKIGHAGTLDPMATGVLPLFFGRATKACDILPQQDKRYLASFRLGITTDTQDITGTVLFERAVEVCEQQLREQVLAFAGESMQVPPMYSAIKVDGKRLYDLARQGVEVDRQARPITIHAIDFISYDEQTRICQMDVHCSKGTYIRTLAADIGEKLGCGAALTALRRTMAAGFTLSDCVTIEQAQQLAAEGKLAEAMLPIGDAFASLPKALLNVKQTTMFLNGVRMDAERIQCPNQKGPLAVYAASGTFLGIAEVVDASFRMIKLFTLEV